MKLSTIINSREAFDHLVENKSLNAKESFLVMRLIKRLDTEWDSFDKARDKLLQKYATQDEKDRRLFHFENKDKSDAFSKEVAEILDTDSDVIVSRVKLRGEIEGITPKDFLLLDEFITVE